MQKVGLDALTTSISFGSHLVHALSRRPVMASDPPGMPPSAANAGERVADFHFDLPPASIAQAPASDRTASRLLLFDRGATPTSTLGHARMADLPSLLRGDELLVLNDTQVVPARLRGRKETGGRVELLALHAIGARSFAAIGKSSKGFAPGMRIQLDRGPLLRIQAMLADGTMQLGLPDDAVDLWALLDGAGETPLPPYVARADGPAAADRERYQTVYARHPGAVAAPTAGLHFTNDLLAALRQKGCETASVTLHVGPGTFTPVRVDRIADHRMHRERWVVAPSEAEVITRARAAKRPILAIGTAVVRTLESVARLHDGAIVAGAGETDIFIRPGFRFQVVDQLLTNFHLPGSTLLMLVSAFSDRERTLTAYREAVAAGYRFYSYGDGMLIR